MNRPSRERSDPTAGEGAPARSRAKIFAIALLALTTLGCGYRVYALIDDHAVNILHHDQWDYYKPLFAGSIAGMFTLQHGPIRQGLGGILLGVVARATDWNTRADSFALATVIALALAAALYLKKRLGHELTAADAILPLLFFNLAQVESFVIVANPAHGAMPLVLAMLYVLAWTLENRIAAYAGVCVLNFFLIFTGFSLFIGVITPVLLLLDVKRHWRTERRLARAPLIAFAIALVSFAVFFIGWKFEPSIDCFQFPHPRPLEYLAFIALMFARFLGVMHAVGFGIALGMLILIALIWIVAVHAIRLVRAPARDNRSVAIVALGTWTLLFCANAAVGRVCAGLGGAQMSRYATLLIPGFVALYLHALVIREPIRTRMLAVLATLLVALPLMNTHLEIELAARYAAGKRQWRDCYLSAKDVAACDAAVQFNVYPTPTIQDRLSYLERNRLNLFSGK